MAPACAAVPAGQRHGTCTHGRVTGALVRVKSARLVSIEHCCVVAGPKPAHRFEATPGAGRPPCLRQNRAQEVGQVRVRSVVKRGTKLHGQRLDGAQRMAYLQQRRREGRLAAPAPLRQRATPLGGDDVDALGAPTPVPLAAIGAAASRHPEHGGVEAHARPEGGAQRADGRRVLVDVGRPTQEAQPVKP